MHVKKWNHRMGRYQDAVEGLRTEVAETASAIDSAIVLINGFVNRLAEALMSDDLAGDIEELCNELDSASAKLATAVAENTAAAEDSDDVYDPTPLGETHEEEDVVLEPELSNGGGEESSDTEVSEQPEFEDIGESSDSAPSTDESSTSTSGTDTGEFTEGAGESSSEDSSSQSSQEGEGEAPPAA